MAMSTLKDDGAKKNMLELTSGKAIKEDMVLMMEPYLNYETFLVPAPMSICILGQLMLVATQADFDLARRPPKGGFKLLRHPGSFRACLQQVANDGYKAFNKAHSSMDKIRLQSIETPNTLKSALNILFKGSPEEIEDMLPIELNQMKNSAEDCLKYAKEAENEFLQVMLVTAELLEACVSTEGQYQQDAREIEIKRTIAEQSIKRLEEDEKEAKQIKERLEKTMDKAEEEYNKALNEIPTGWHLVGMQATENVTNFVSGALNCATLGLSAKMLAAEKTAVKGMHFVTQNMKGFTNLADKVSKGIAGAAGAAGATSGQGQTRGSNEPQAEEFVHILDQKFMQSFQGATKVHSKTQLLYNMFVKAGETPELKPNPPNQDWKQQVAMCETEFRCIKAELQSTQDEIAVLVKQLCDGLISLCTDLKDTVGTLNVDESSGKDVAERLTELHNKAMQTESKADAIMRSAQLDVGQPFRAQEQATPTNAEEERAAKDIAAENAKVKLAQTSETLKYQQERYDKACQRLKENSQELRQFMADAAQLDMKKLDFEKIRETLRRGIQTFAELREQWSKIVQFFQMTTNIIEVCLHKSVKKLTENVDQAKNRTLNGYSIHGLRKDMIYQQTFQTAKISYIINMVSSSYVEVSQAHVMSRIAGLGKLLAYNPETDKQLIQQAMFELTTDFEQAQDDIMERVKKKKVPTATLR